MGMRAGWYVFVAGSLAVGVAATTAEPGRMGASRPATQQAAGVGADAVRLAEELGLSKEQEETLTALAREYGK